MYVLVADVHLGWHLVDGLHNTVDISLRDDCGSILFLTKKEIQVTVLGEKFDTQLFRRVLYTSVLKSSKLLSLDSKDPRVRVTGHRNCFQHEHHAVAHNRFLAGEEGNLIRRGL